MKTHNIVQGSQVWHDYRAKHFNASDVPAMLGISKYKTRGQLLKEMATGISQEFDAATEARFADGHRFEALARPIAENIVGAELYPITASEGKLSASFDGLTMDEKICFEHKTLNKNSLGEIAEEYRAQMEQQLMVSGAEKCLFMASKWDENDNLIEERHAYYVSDQAMRDRIVQGWVQFSKDIENYQHVEVIPTAIAAPTKDLPALSIQVNGSISLISNLAKFGAELNTFVAAIDKEPTDDQGFADAEAAIKTLQSAQDALETAEANALAQTSDIDDMRKTVKLYADTARTTRLMLEKMVKARKDSLRLEIMQGGKDKLAEHIATLNKRLGKPYIPAITADFAGAVKNKRTIASLRESVNNELLRCQLESSAVADKIEINLNSLRELAKDHFFLFLDTQTIVLKNNDDLVVLIKVRIDDHEKEIAAKFEVERAKMQAEATAKAEREAAEKLVSVSATVKQSLTVEPVKVVDIRKPSRPAHAELIQFVANNFNVSYDQACTWVIETAESIKKSV